MNVLWAILTPELVSYTTCFLLMNSSHIYINVMKFLRQVLKLEISFFFFDFQIPLHRIVKDIHLKNLCI